MFHNIEKTDSLMDQMRKRIGKLERFNDHITSCSAVVEKRQDAVANGTE